MGVTDNGGVGSVHNELAGGGGHGGPAAASSGREEAREREGGTANLVR